MDPGTIIAITSISAVGIGILGKVMYTLRHNVKNCFGIVFRTPDSQSRHSPRASAELNEVKQHFENTLNQIKITPSIKSDSDAVKDLENKIKVKELEHKLKELEGNCERIYI